MRRKILIVQVSPRRGGRGAQVDGRYHLLHGATEGGAIFLLAFRRTRMLPRVSSRERENPVRVRSF